MPYIGRDLNRGNYLKLDDISSSFNSSTKTFDLKVILKDLKNYSC